MNYFPFMSAHTWWESNYYMWWINVHWSKYHNLYNLKYWLHRTKLHGEPQYLWASHPPTPLRTSLSILVSTGTSQSTPGPTLPCGRFATLHRTRFLKGFNIPTGDWIKVPTSEFRRTASSGLNLCLYPEAQCKLRTILTWTAARQLNMTLQDSKMKPLCHAQWVKSIGWVTDPSCIDNHPDKYHSPTLETNATKHGTPLVQINHHSQAHLVQSNQTRHTTGANQPSQPSTSSAIQNNTAHHWCITTKHI